MTSVYESRPIKERRTKRELLNIRWGLYDIVNQYKPMTCRQVFYQAVSKGLIAKTEAEYKGTVIRLLGDMRKSGDMPFSWLVDSTRWMRKPDTYGSLKECLRSTAICYRRMFWADQNVQVEVWSEKDAIAGVLYDVTQEYDVPLMVTRGYPSLTYLHESAAALRENGKPAYIFYFGDCDPSGRDITRATEERLREFAPDVEINFVLSAVTDEQIWEMELPTRPTKKTDTRSKGWDRDSVEVDAIEPDTLREIVRSNITQFIDPDIMHQTNEIERKEKEQLWRLAGVNWMDDDDGDNEETEEEEN